jgi:hypothetical protein
MRVRARTRMRVCGSGAVSERRVGKASGQGGRAGGREGGRQIEYRDFCCSREERGKYIFSLQHHHLHREAELAAARPTQLRMRPLYSTTLRSIPRAETRTTK